jgi:hypothetical protein
MKKGKKKKRRRRMKRRRDAENEGCVGRRSILIPGDH